MNFKNIMKKNNNEDCGCFGEEHNKKSAEQLANCCFPLLACGKKNQN